MKYLQELFYKIFFEEDSDGGMTEIRFVPDDRNTLDSMFAVMSECQALHPDADDSLEEEEDEEAEEGEEPGMYDDAEEDVNVGGDGHEQMDAE